MIRVEQKNPTNTYIINKVNKKAERNLLNRILRPENVQKTKY